jgi:hypothetical protein
MESRGRVIGDPFDRENCQDRTANRFYPSVIVPPDGLSRIPLEPVANGSTFAGAKVR